jgi:probable F420-dependent oxidoreductase
MAMKLGIAPPNYAAWFGAEEACAIARQAEAWGFDSIWFGDHLAIPSDEADVYGNAFLDCFTLLAYIANVTSLRLGTHIAVVPYRHPIALAKIAATLDVLTGGNRIVLGVGAGHVPREAAALGTDYASRGAVTDEYLAVMQALWTQDVVSFHGKWVEFDDMCPMTRPVTAPFPLLVGGSNAVSMRRAIRFGASWTPMVETPATLAPKLVRLRELAEQSQRPVPAVVMHTSFHLVEDGSPIPPANPRNEIQRPRMTVRAAADLIAGFGELGVDELIIDVPPGRHAYLDQLGTVVEKVLPMALG